jgi:predicted transcriptional regulator
MRRIGRVDQEPNGPTPGWQLFNSRNDLEQCAQIGPMTRSELRLRTAREFEALLGSPARMELVDACQAAAGPCSVADLARRTGRRPSSLYHHLRQLEAAGTLVRAGTRPAGRRREALYAVAARRVRIAADPQVPESQDAVERGARLVLRLAERDFRRHGAAPGGWRGADTWREKAWLSADDLRELGARLEQLRAFLRQRSRPGEGRLIALTLSTTELPAPSPR